MKKKQKQQKEIVKEWELPAYIVEFEEENRLPKFDTGTEKQVKFARHSRYTILEQYQRVIPLLPDADIDEFREWYSQFKLRTNICYWIDHRYCTLHNIWCDWSNCQEMPAKPTATAEAIYRYYADAYFKQYHKPN